MTKSRKKSRSKSRSKSTEYKLQSIVIPMTAMSESGAKKWAKNHYGKTINKMDITPNTYRFRVISADVLKKKGYKHFKTKVLTNGVELILAYKH